MTKPPAFQLYPHDFLGGTGEFTAEETGIYIRLMCYQWIKGGLDPHRVKLMAGSYASEDSLKSVLAKFETGPDGLLRNKRLEQVRSDLDDYRSRQRDLAQKGWQKRKETDGLAMPTHMPTHMPNACSSSSSSVRTYTPQAPGSAASSDFGSITQAEASAQASMTGIDPAFSDYIFADWSSREGKDGSGCAVKWLPYATKRWNRERDQWISKTHTGNKPNDAHKQPNNRNTGTWNERVDPTAYSKRVIRAGSR